MRLKKIADKQAFEAAKQARAAAAKAAKDARDLAFKQEVEARKRRDAELAAAHKKKMLEKKLLERRINSFATGHRFELSTKGPESRCTFQRKDHSPYHYVLLMSKELRLRIKGPKEIVWWKTFGI